MGLHGHFLCRAVEVVLSFNSGYTPRELLYDKPQYGVVLALGFGCNFLYLKLIDAE